MENKVESIERFAHDVCVHVLEKFGIFKTPDDTRKQNRYLRHNFLPLISKSVVSFALWIRLDFKNWLEDRGKVSDLGNDAIKWIFDDYLVLNDKFSGKHWTEKVCFSLALCTEYIHFARAKVFTVSLNKLVVGWGEFFGKHLRADFEKNLGFLKLYEYCEMSQIEQLDDFQESFIMAHCFPYGSKECTEEYAKMCIERHGFNISLNETIFGIKKYEYLEQRTSEGQDQAGPNSNLNVNLMADSERCEPTDIGAEIKESKPKEVHFERSDSGDSASHFSEKDVKESQDGDSEASDLGTSKNNLLGIPPHEEMLREIDPFFVEHIQSPPKAGPSPKSPKRKSAAIRISSSSSFSSDSESGSDGSASMSPNSEQPPSELKENVNRIISKLEKDLSALKTLLFQNGLLSRKSRRRGHRSKAKAEKSKKPPQDPEGSIPTAL